MAISTVRPDGWPQTTIVGYANEGFTMYFLIFRSSQKFANIQQDDRVSIAVATEPKEIRETRAVYAGAIASEVTAPKLWERAWQLLVERHPNLADFELPDRSQAALMQADCKYLSVLDYGRAPGHTEAFTIGTEALETHAARTEDWGKSACQKGGNPKKPD